MQKGIHSHGQLPDRNSADSGPHSEIQPNQLKSALQSAFLYGILDLGYVAEDIAAEVTHSLIVGGIGLLQLRAKACPLAQIERLGRQLLPLCREAGIPFIINDHPSLAAELGADGLHLGQDDGSLAEARQQVGPAMIIGRSTHSPEQARAALAEGFDYIGFGPLFATPTKKGRPGIGLTEIATVEQEIGAHIPVFCIGGIKRTNLPEVLGAGAQRVVIVSELLTATDVEAATQAVISDASGALF